MEERENNFECDTREEREKNYERKNNSEDR